MSAFAERVRQDLIKLNALSDSTGNRVKVVNTSGNPVTLLDVELDYDTAGGRDYPKKTQRPTKVRIQLSSRYPFQEPNAKITTPIFHPNVYSSGQICFGTKWLPTQGLDLLVKRVIQIITFEPIILNAASPANGSALTWYSSAVRRHPEAFPTDKLELASELKKSKISWSNVSEEPPSKVVTKCPGCGTGLKLPAGRKGHVSCPKCKHRFFVST